MSTPSAKITIRRALSASFPVTSESDNISKKNIPTKAKQEMSSAKVTRAMLDSGSTHPEIANNHFMLNMPEATTAKIDINIFLCGIGQFGSQR